MTRRLRAANKDPSLGHSRQTTFLPCPILSPGGAQRAHTRIHYGTHSPELIFVLMRAVLFGLMALRGGTVGILPILLNPGREFFHA